MPYEILKQPFPVQDTYRVKITTSLTWGIVIAAFAAFVHPFDLEAFPLMYALLYGLIAMLCSLFVFCIGPLLLPRYFDEEYWTVGRHLLVCIIGTILAGSINYIYVNIIGSLGLVYTSWGWTLIHYWEELCAALAVSLPGLVIFTLILERVQLQKNLIRAITLSKHLRREHRRNQNIQQHTIIRQLEQHIQELEKQLEHEFQSRSQRYLHATSLSIVSIERPEYYEPLHSPLTSTLTSHQPAQALLSSTTSEVTPIKTESIASSEQMINIGTNQEQAYFLPVDILCIRANENYVHIYCYDNTNQDGSVKHHLVRTTMKQVSERLQEYKNIYRCHKSYIVNINYVSTISGNAQGTYLHIDYLDFPIPVSRSLQKEIFQRLEQVKHLVNN